MELFNKLIIIGIVICLLVMAHASEGLGRSTDEAIYRSAAGIITTLFLIIHL